MNPEEKGLLMDEIAIDVSLISFMTVISVFFTGALLPQFNTYNLSIKIPLSFLIISTLAFLFSALILSNATQRIVSNEMDKAKKYLQYGYAISEYLGVYLFILSIPLLVNIVTDDLYLRVVTFLSVIMGMGLYQFLGFSLLEKHFSKKYHVVSFLTIILSFALFLSQVLTLYFTIASIVFLLFIVLVTYLALAEEAA